MQDRGDVQPAQDQIGTSRPSQTLPAIENKPAVSKKPTPKAMKIIRWFRPAVFSTALLLFASARRERARQSRAVRVQPRHIEVAGELKFRDGLREPHIKAA